MDLKTNKERLDHANQQIGIYTPVIRKLAEKLRQRCELIVHALDSGNTAAVEDRHDLQHTAARLDMLCEHLSELFRHQCVLEVDVDAEQDEAGDVERREKIEQGHDRFIEQTRRDRAISGRVSDIGAIGGIGDFQDQFATGRRRPAAGHAGLRP